jgi:hypothetical protein
MGICLAGLIQLNHEDREDRKEQYLRGLWGPGGSNSSRFANG